MTTFTLTRSSIDPRPRNRRLRDVRVQASGASGSGQAAAVDVPTRLSQLVDDLGEHPVHGHDIYLPLLGGIMGGDLNTHHLIPVTTNLYNLGSASKIFQYLYARYIMSNASYVLRLGIGAGDYEGAYITIRTNGKVTLGGDFTPTKAVETAAELGLGGPLFLLGTGNNKRIYFDDTHYLELDSNGHLHTNVGFYSDSFITAKGLGSGGGGGGIDVDRMWQELASSGNEQIAIGHLVNALGGYQPLIDSSHKLAYSLLSGTPDLSVYALTGHTHYKLVHDTGKALSAIDATASSANVWDSTDNAWILQNSNNALAIAVGGVSNDRNALIQVGHAMASYGDFLGTLFLNKLGGDVRIGAGSSAVYIPSLGDGLVKSDASGKLSVDTTSYVSSVEVGTGDYANNIDVIKGGQRTHLTVPFANYSSNADKLDGLHAADLGRGRSDFVIAAAAASTAAYAGWYTLFTLPDMSANANSGVHRITLVQRSQSTGYGQPWAVDITIYTSLYNQIVIKVEGGTSGLVNAFRYCSDTRAFQVYNYRGYTVAQQYTIYYNQVNQFDGARGANITPASGTVAKDTSTHTGVTSIPWTGGFYITGNIASSGAISAKK